MPRLRDRVRARTDDQNHMNSRQLHLRVRPVWAAVILACASALVLGFSSGPASARTQSRTQIAVVGTSPAQPTAGANFTGKFKLMKDGTALHITTVSCMAQINGRRAQVVAQGTDGTVGRCGLAIPSDARGKYLDGVVAVQGPGGIWYYLGFDLPIR
jgi:hypothetical protein